jgi:hypothetical protein
MKKHPNVTLKKITLLWLDGYSWEEISEKLSVKVGSISCFFNRAIKDKNLVAAVKLYLAQILFIVAILLNYGDTH